MKIHNLLSIPMAICLVACQDEAINTAPTEAPSQHSSQNSQTTEVKPVVVNHEGEKLHQEKCSGCHMVSHDADFYQQPTRKMKSYERLQSQVRLCNANLNLELFDEDMTFIGEYLNESYYKFPVN